MKRTLTGVAIALAVAASGWTLAGAQEKAAGPVIDVYKSPTCGCCAIWVDHLRENGFKVTVTDVPNVTALKQRLGIRPELSSCHTAIVDDYAIEGHVPASDIHRLLRDGPRVAGLAVPGMPLGSPGMEMPDPSRHERYDVLTFDREGNTEVWATHGP